MCRGVAGGVASILNPPFLSPHNAGYDLAMFLRACLFYRLSAPSQVLNQEVCRAVNECAYSYFIFRICLSPFMASSRFSISLSSGYEKVSQAAYTVCRGFR